MDTLFGVPVAALIGQVLIGLINGSFYALLSLGLASLSFVLLVSHQIDQAFERDLARAMWLARGVRVMGLPARFDVRTADGNRALSGRITCATNSALPVRKINTASNVVLVIAPINPVMKPYKP